MPLFPLANVWLLPFVVLPLHIFEERYRQLIEDSLDGPGRLILGTIQEDHEGEAAGNPPIYSLAGYGEIGRHERLDDGRFNIWLVGLKRMWIEEVESERLYRKVAIHPTEEIEVPREREGGLRTALSAAIAERVENVDPAHESLPLSRLVDLLTLRLPIPHEVMNRLYSELDLEKRARLALEEHRQRPEKED